MTMKYKILMYDGHAVDTVLYDRIVYEKENPPKLLVHTTTIDMLVKKIIYHEPWRSKCERLIRKCDLVEVELTFTQEI